MTKSRLVQHPPTPVWRYPQACFRYIRHQLRWAYRRSQWRRHGLKWAVSQYRIDGAEVEIGGWAITPPSRRPNVVFTCNGMPLEGQYPIGRPDVAAKFVRAPWAEPSGFEMRGRLAAAPAPGSMLRFECVDRATGRPIHPSYYPYFSRVPSAGDPPVPETNRRQRVIGQDSHDYFLSSGVEQYGRFDDALRRVCVRGFDGFANVLDWGCGCGRISRYLTHRGRAAFTCVDVDPDNVAWCRANLPGGRFESIPLHPPTQFADGEFDAVFGLSVFTHLREPDQFEWLTELRRIVRPGGVLLLTIHCDSYLWVSPMCLTPAQERIRRRKGFVAVGNSQYDANLSEADYYQNIFHSHAYVQQNWSKYLTVREIVPGFIGNQDLVIAERPAL
jgi:2-polyprenyl-3-methyl-5-hydroxy-6-metoxy-1,4-benzoquinol methylase